MKSVIEYELFALGFDGDVQSRMWVNTPLFVEYETSPLHRYWPKVRAELAIVDREVSLKLRAPRADRIT